MFFIYKNGVISFVSPRSILFFVLYCIVLYCYLHKSDMLRGAVGNRKDGCSSIVVANQGHVRIINKWMWCVPLCSCLFFCSNKLINRPSLVILHNERITIEWSRD